jgi:YYY domain-containing protein
VGGWLLAGAVACFLTFRVLQPYAFNGHGFFGFGPSQDWLGTLKLLAAQSGPLADAPPALQWARRPLWFSGQNLVLWGLGLPLGVLAWAGFAGLGPQLLRGRGTRPLLLIWGWVAVYFGWQSLANNPTMRYQLPVYSGLVLLAAWGVSEVWRYGIRLTGTRPRAGPALRIAAAVVAATVLVTTALWAFAMTRIYTRPVTRVEASRWLLNHAPGPLNLQVRSDGGLITRQPVSCPGKRLVTARRPYLVTTTIRHGGTLEAIDLPHADDPTATATTSESQVLTLALFAGTRLDQELVRTTVTVPRTAADPQGQSLSWAIEPPLPVVAGESLSLALILEGGGSLRFAGAAIANESSWDDGLPLRLDGYDPYGGLYQEDLNFEMYWPDNEEKRQRLVSILDRSDYLVISSSRQWGSIPRLPERYPLTIAYYRNLLGCPAELTVEACYNRAEVGTYSGRLGFDLVKVAVSHPNLGSWQINDQASEEAFTVYDHPKVMIFKRSPDYDPDRGAAILGQVDLSRVIHVLPAQARARSLDLLLPAERLAEQRAGGTWSELYGRDRLINRSQPVTVLVWYLVLAVLGLIAFPIVRLALPGLPDQGYGFSRIAGLVMLTWLVWISGSLRIPFCRTTITLALLVMAGIACALALRERARLAELWRSLQRQVITFEVLFLVLFIAGLLIRLGNPDLWHAGRGGEKPMELAYFNAVLKSTSFPPYDPWFAGGYLNYYYYGWLLVGILVRWLGIVPTVAFNLILATLFALIASGAYCIGRGIVTRRREHERTRVPLLAGLAAALGMAVVGNLGTLQMILVGLQRLVAGDALAGAGLLDRAWWTLQGLGRFLGGAELPYSLGDWYWNPTRIIPDPSVRPITELPFFSFLFGDLHPHLIDLPLTLLVIGWVASLIRWQWQPASAPVTATARTTWRQGRQLIAVLALGSLAVGALRPTNTWSFYTYLILAALALAYAVWRRWSGTSQGRVLAAAAAALLLVWLAHLLYQPYASWYGAAYTSAEPWQGAHTPLDVYLLHWGLFLFVLVSWMLHETQALLSRSTGGQLHRWWLLLPVAPTAVLLPLLLLKGVVIAWVVVPLAAWAGVLLLYPGLPDSRRLPLFLLGTALAITITVEVVVLQGDIGRMNTVFKLYMQAWTMLAVASGAAVGWLLPALRDQGRWQRLAWSLTGTCLLGSALLYPIVATPARLRDRMAEGVPHSLDGMAYMEHAIYFDQDTALVLDEDWRAIRWLQDNVSGSPVILEGHTVEYRWGSRFSIYTGLPGVIGWNWHQRQQRAVVPQGWVWDRVQAVRSFYTTTDIEAACAFLRKHQVSYIIVGQLERAYYQGPGLDKLAAGDGTLWRAVYRDGVTTIYHVIPGSEADPTSVLSQKDVP